MKNKNIIYIATAIIIILIVSAAFIYANYNTPAQPAFKGITVIDDEGYATNITQFLRESFR